MNLVVFNPGVYPIQTSEGQVDGGGWKHITNESSVDRYLNQGFLLVTQIPDRESAVPPEAQKAFQSYWEAEDTLAAENKKVRDTSPVPNSTKSSPGKKSSKATIEKEKED